MEHQLATSKPPRPKLGIALALITLVGGGLAIASRGGWFVDATHDSPSVAVVREIESDVRHKPVEDEAWYRAKTNTEIIQGDAIYSGPTSRASVQMHSGGTLDLGANTMVVFDDIDGVMIPDVTRGQVRIKLNGNFRIAISGETSDFSGAQSELILSVDGKKRSIRVVNGTATITRASEAPQMISDVELVLPDIASHRPQLVMPEPPIAIEGMDISLRRRTVESLPIAESTEIASSPLPDDAKLSGPMPALAPDPAPELVAMPAEIPPPQEAKTPVSVPRPPEIQATAPAEQIQDEAADLSKSFSASPVEEALTAPADSPAEPTRETAITPGRRPFKVWAGAGAVFFNFHQTSSLESDNGDFSRFSAPLLAAGASVDVSENTSLHLSYVNISGDAKYKGESPLSSNVYRWQTLIAEAELAHSRTAPWTFSSLIGLQYHMLPFLTVEQTTSIGKLSQISLLSGSLGAKIGYSASDAYDFEVAARYQLPFTSSSGDGYGFKAKPVFAFDTSVGVTKTYESGFQVGASWLAQYQNHGYEFSRAGFSASGNQNPLMSSFLLRLGWSFGSSKSVD